MASSVRQIQGTNDSSIVSKKSMVTYGYFSDDFVGLMTSKTTRRAPLINRGYYIRAKAIDYVIQKFISNFCQEQFQIVCLGAGFDTTYFRLKSQNKLENCVYVEIDFFDVARSKAQLIANHETLRDCISSSPLNIREDSYLVINTPQYKIVGTDMTHTNVLEACLRACQLSYEAPTLFLSECVITYMSKRGTSNLISLVSRTFNLATFVLYEQIFPNDSFGRFMCSHFKKLGSPLRCIEYYKTREDQVQRFQTRGWNYVELVDMNEFYSDYISEKEHQRVEELEVFDEYEEWHLKCSHYFVLVAQKNKPISMFPRSLISAAFDVAVSDVITLPVARLPTTTTFSPAGVVKAHTLRACLLPLTSDKEEEECLVRACGYGQDPLGCGHARLTSLTCVPLGHNGEALGVTHTLPEKHEALDASIYRSMCQLSSYELLLFGGRTSPLRANSSLVKLSFRPESNSVESLKPVCKIVDFGDCGDQAWPSARWRHTAAIYWIRDCAYMLLYGGRTLEEKVMEDAWIYDVSKECWFRVVPTTLFSILSPVVQLGPNSTLHSLLHPLTQQPDSSCSPTPGPLLDGTLTPLSPPCQPCQCLNKPTVDQSLTACCGCCCLLLIGGRDSNLRPSDQVWRWCGREQTWFLHRDLHLPSPRFSHTTHLVRPGVFAVLGGVMGHSRTLQTRTTPAERLCLVDINKNNATDFFLDMSALRNDLLMPHNHASVLTKTGDLIVLGGGGNCFSFGTHLNTGLFKIPLSTLTK